MTFFSCNTLSVNPLRCVLMINQECKVRRQISNINSANPFLYLYSILVNKCSSSCNNIKDPYAKVCVTDVVKIITAKYLI